MPLLFTTIDWVTAPLDQSHDEPLLAVSVTLSPAQKVVGPLAVIVGRRGRRGGDGHGGGRGTQPLPSVTVTVNVPLLLTTIDCVVAPLDQSQELAALAVRVTLPPAQNVVGPSAVIVGTGGGLLTVTGWARSVERAAACVEDLHAMTAGCVDHDRLCGRTVRPEVTGGRGRGRE